jgi:GAF domain-containing protein
VAQDRLKLLLELTNQVVSNLELRDLLHAVSASVRRVIQCDLVGVALPDPDRKHLRLYALDFPESQGLVREEIFLLPIEGSVLPGPTDFRMGKPWTGSVRDLPQIDPNLPPVAEGLKTGCVQPLISRNEVLGILGLSRFEENPFTQDEVDFLGQVAKQIAIAVDNALAYQQIAGLKDQLTQEKDRLRLVIDTIPAQVWSTLPDGSECRSRFLGSTRQKDIRGVARSSCFTCTRTTSPSCNRSSIVHPTGKIGILIIDY